MKKDLAEVKAYAEAMAESNCARDVYVDKEQDKFFCQLNRQWVDIDALKDRMEQSELRARALELENKSLLARLCQDMRFLNFYLDQFYAPSLNNLLSFH